MTRTCEFETLLRGGEDLKPERFETLDKHACNESKFNESLRGGGRATAFSRGKGKSSAKKRPWKGRIRGFTSLR